MNRGRARRAEVFVALIRGVNVGKAKPVSMSDLRDIVGSLGHRDVETVMRSGNVVFSGSGTSDRVRHELERALHARLDLTVRIIIRTAAELAAVVTANPIREAEADGSRLHVMFLEAALTAEDRDRLVQEDFGIDEVQPREREIYVWYRNAMAGSNTAKRLARLLGATATDRNWNTVTRLNGLAAARR